MATHGRAPEGLPLPLPGSLRLVASAVRRRRLSALSGLLPRGMRSIDEIRGLTHAAASGGWPTAANLWLHTCALRSGGLVTLGREGAPDAPLADAVAASCAVPSYYRPVAIGGELYVDGGLRSLTNADQLVGEGCDTVLILSPFSTRNRGALLDTALLGAARAFTAAQIEREADRLRADGADVHVIGPTAADIRMMGVNPMERTRSRAVLKTAARSVRAQIAQDTLALA